MRAAVCLHNVSRTYSSVKNWVVRTVEGDRSWRARSSQASSRSLTFARVLTNAPWLHCTTNSGSAAVASRLVACAVFVWPT
ncbi:MAG: hypothetical protein ACKV2O_12350 [Acidimicrobiales bacterium]